MEAGCEGPTGGVNGRKYRTLNYSSGRKRGVPYVFLPYVTDLKWLMPISRVKIWPLWYHLAPLFVRFSRASLSADSSGVDEQNSPGRRPFFIMRVWGEIIRSVSRTKARAFDAVPKMGVGLPEPACRSWLQTARCCCVQKARWRTAGEEASERCQVGIARISGDERKQTVRRCIVNYLKLCQNWGRADAPG